MSTTRGARMASTGHAPTALRGSDRRATSAGVHRAASFLLLLLVLFSATATASARPVGGGASLGILAGTPAPKVTLQPSSVTVLEGQGASFSAAASGSPTIQWELSSNGGISWHAIEGAAAGTFSIAATKTSENANQYRALFVNAGGEVASKAATLTVQKAPIVIKQPLDALAEEGHSVTFEASAEGTPAPTVQWQSSVDGGTSWKSVSKATANVLTLTGVKNAEDGTKFRAVFKNSAGEATSGSATLTVSEPPKVTKQPVNTTVTEGQFAIFEATASAFPTATIQWELSTDAGTTWAPIPEATFTQLAVTGTHGSLSGNEYRAVFTNPAGTVTSNVATLTVQARPLITQQPEDTTVLLGSEASFEAIAKGTPTPTVKWEASTDSGASWSAVSGASSNLITIPGTQLSQSGEQFRAAFTNNVGTTFSSPATLTVSATNYTAFGWGMNTRGQVGSGSSESAIAAPVPIKGLSFVTAVSGGLRHSLALLADGSVESWGYNGHGQLGNEGAIGTRTPIVIEHLKGVRAIAAGGNHSLALLSDGSILAWGDDEHGQLGNGKSLDSEVPVAVQGISGATAIAAGEEHSLALMGNGTVMAWGNNERGQLGTNGNSSNTPVLVKGLSGVTAIAADGQFSLALLSDGTVVAWGDDEHGQLGNEAFLQEEETEAQEEEGRYSPTPLPVEGLSGVKAIAAGRTHALALLNNGTVEAWGNDTEGELGNGILEPRASTPVTVSNLSGVTGISAGDQDSVALLTGGSLEAWGSNVSGSLGDGSIGGLSDIPMNVLNVAGAAGVSAGGSHMLAFGASLPAVTAISPKSGAIGGGTSVTITGVSLGGTTAVHFGATSAATFTINSATSVTATSPAGSGTVDVTITTPAGTSPAGAADRFSYRPPPTVSKLSAKGGPATGGTSITITGTELSGTTNVEFGGVAASQFTVVSATTITAVAPAHVAGTTDVRVTTGSGQSSASTKDRFKYTPTVEGFSPPSGPLAGGTNVVISGSGFVPGTGGTIFKFGKAKSKSVQCASSTSCTVLLPAQSTAGVVDVRATANKASSVIAPGDRFTYE
jgi:alpha-tubulin suppressor-like RCC1 family protein